MRTNGVHGTSATALTELDRGALSFVPQTATAVEPAEVPEVPEVRWRLDDGS